MICNLKLFFKLNYIVISKNIFLNKKICNINKGEVKEKYFHFVSNILCFNSLGNNKF